MIDVCRKVMYADDLVTYSIEQTGITNNAGGVGGGAQEAWSQDEPGEDKGDVGLDGQQREKLYIRLEGKEIKQVGGGKQLLFNWSSVREIDFCKILEYLSRNYEAYETKLQCREFLVVLQATG